MGKTTTKATAFVPVTCVPLHGSHHASVIITRRRPRLSPPPKTTQTINRANSPSAILIKRDEKPSTEVLDMFSCASRGEWTGYEGRFCSNTGKAHTIPDYYIPDEFIEWGLVPKGFETNHSVIVRNDKLYRKFFRILPTVSLFADHVDLEEDLVIIPIIDEEKKIETTVFKDGSFISGLSSVSPKRESKLEKWPSLSFCIRDDDNANMKKKAINLWISFNFERGIFVDDIRAIVENYSCEYCDGADLEGSSGFVDGWPSQPQGSKSDLEGQWSSSSSPSSSHFGSENTEVTQQLFLPHGIDISIARMHDENALQVRAAWLVEQNRRIVLVRHFSSDGTVQFSQRDIETRI